MKDLMKNHCKSHFESHKLCKSDLQGLMELQKSYHKMRGRSLWQNSWVRMTSSAAALVLVFLGAFSLNDAFNKPIADKIALDISKNHRQFLASNKWDVEADNFQQAANKLTNLGFKLRPTSHTKNLKLKAGKYCNIFGKKAAQLRYVSTKDGKNYTVYQAPLPKKLASQKFNRVTKEVDGVKVIMWKENGLLHGMAEGAKPVRAFNSGQQPVRAFR